MKMSVYCEKGDSPGHGVPPWPFDPGARLFGKGEADAQGGRRFAYEPESGVRVEVRCRKCGAHMRIKPAPES